MKYCVPRTSPNFIFSVLVLENAFVYFIHYRLQSMLFELV